MSRPTWDEYFLSMATLASTRAACTRAQVGAVIVDADRRVIATGYNGAPSGEVHCTDGGCPRGLLTYEQAAIESAYDNCVAIHAEMNAIMQAGPDAAGCVMYTSRRPCPECEVALSVVRLQRVVSYDRGMATNLSWCKACSKRFTYDGDETRLYCDTCMDSREGAIQQAFEDLTAAQLRKQQRQGGQAVPGVYSQEQADEMEQRRGWHGL